MVSRAWGGEGGWGVRLAAYVTCRWPLFVAVNVYSFSYFSLISQRYRLRSAPSSNWCSWMRSLAPGIPRCSDGWSRKGWWLPYSGHTHMSVSRAVFISCWGNQPFASVWLRLPSQAGRWLIPQMGISAVAVGCRSQDTLVSSHALLSRGNSLAATVGRTWCPCWKPTCQSQSLSPSPTGPWWEVPPSAWNPLLPIAVCWVLNTWPAWPSMRGSSLTWFGVRSLHSRSATPSQISLCRDLIRQPSLQSSLWVVDTPTPQPSQ